MADLDIIQQEVNTAIEEIFNKIKEEAGEEYLILFLENGHKIELEGKQKYVLGQGIAGANDMDRISFIKKYMNFLKPALEEYNQNNNNDRELENLSLTLEMLIYVHVWESNFNLQTIKQLSNLCKGQYDWDIGIPSWKRSDFIKKASKEFKKLKIGKIIDESYIPQLRNALAHSQYHFSSEKIILDNYNGKNNNLKEVQINDFEVYFLRSILLFWQIDVHRDPYIEQLGRENSCYKVTIPEQIKKEKLLNYHPKKRRFTLNS